MKDKWNFHDKDIEFLEDVGKMEMAMVAQKWAKILGWQPEKQQANARNWLHRVRVRITRCQNYLNHIRGLQKASARIRKFSTSGELPTPEEEEEEEKWRP